MWTPSKLDCILTQLVEGHKRGYPRYAALIGAHVPFFLCRRFNRLRARLLLLKQDKLSLLEEKLDNLDRNERSPLFLGKSRLDANVERLSTIAAIESSLKDYGESTNRHELIPRLGR